MGGLLSRLQAHFYPDPLTRDAVGVFLRHLDEAVTSSDVVLDIGAGAGELNRYELKGKVRQMIGTDLDPRVTSNRLLDLGIIGDGRTLPVDDASIDLAFSIYTQEHVEDPARFAREVYRVLKMGGRYLAITPNRFHYVPLIAAVTPTSFHRSVNARRGRQGEDTFSTFYRLNTASAMSRCFGAAGFSEVTTRGIEVEPQYLKFNAAAYLCGVGYERLVNATESLAALRVNLIVECAKR